MRQFISFILVTILVACSPSKKTATTEKAPAHKITKKDIFKGGTSFDNPIVIKVRSENAGIAEEYKWLAQSYPGYSTIRKTQASRGKRHYDIITFKTRDGIERDAYFDITSFFRK